MKRAYLASGTLINGVTSKDVSISVDPSTWNYLSNLITGNYCYLILGGIEVVKVQEAIAPNILLLVRGLEGTCVQGWPAGESIEYGFTQSELNDAVVYKGYSISLQNNLQYDSAGAISYPAISMLGIGGIDVDGNGYIWTISDSTELGCESLEPSTPPPIPPQYQPYRICDPISGPDYRIMDSGDYRMWA